MAKAGDNLNARLEKGLKALADERVAVPAHFRAQVMRRIARETGLETPRLTHSLGRRLQGWFARPAWALGAAGVLALAFGVALNQGDAPKPRENLASAPASATEPEPAQGAALAQAASAGPQASSMEKEVEKTHSPAQAVAAPEKLYAMPQRLPRSLDALAAGGTSAPAAQAAQKADPASAVAVAAGEPIRIVVTPQPTPMAHGFEGFSQARRNVFKPGQGEYTAILFVLEDSDHVTVRVYDFNGRVVAELLEENRPAGLHEVRWSGYNARGELAGAGKYVVLVKARDSRQVARHKIALIR